jgi:hypothetical protein
MGKTSNKVKQRFNKTRYTQVKVSVNPEIAAAFKEKCFNDGISMASEISRFMSEQTNINRKKKLQAEPFGTRQRRRKALVSLIGQLEEILDAEQDYWHNIPINLQNGQAYEAAEHAVSALEEVLSLLHGAYW